MSKPTPEELQSALALAKRMRETGKDPQFIAKSLLSHDYRLTYLEEVLHAVERFLHSGQADDEHQRLLKLLERVRRAEERTSHQASNDLGLG
ncbi:MAG: hypothetical protein GC149_13235 [Gammaproteobacteria bacterium]|nr:hypothetical protein [Gammaproteobacteria bacterium]